MISAHDSINFEKQPPGPVECLGAPPTDVYVTAWVEAEKKPYVFAHPMVGWPLVDLPSIFGVYYSIAAGVNPLADADEPWVSMWDEQQGRWFIRKAIHKIQIPANRCIFVRPAHFQDEDCLGLQDHIPQSVDLADPTRHSQKLTIASLDAGGTINSQEKTSKSLEGHHPNSSLSSNGDSSTLVLNKSEPNKDAPNSSTSSTNETSDLLDSDPPVEGTNEESGQNQDPLFWVESEYFANPLEAAIVRVFHENFSESKGWMRSKWIEDQLADCIWKNSRLAKLFLDSNVWIDYRLNQTLDTLAREGWVARSVQPMSNFSYFKGWKLVELERSNEHPKRYSNPVHWIGNKYFSNPLESAILRSVRHSDLEIENYNNLRLSINQNKDVAAALLDYGIWVNDHEVKKTGETLSDQGYLAYADNNGKPRYRGGPQLKFLFS